VCLHQALEHIINEVTAVTDDFISFFTNAVCTLSDGMNHLYVNIICPVDINLVCYR
jgi:hypothetical protein